MRKDKLLLPLDGDFPLQRANPLNVTQNWDTRFPSAYKKLANYTLTWRNRLLLESTANPCMFVTFTYDNDHYPETPGCDVQSVLKKSWQDFRDRFDYHLKVSSVIKKFKYYTVSERGEDGRLHFHALIYGFPYTTYRGKNQDGRWVEMVLFNQYTKLIEKAWRNGFVYFEAVSSRVVNYVTKYIHKRIISGDYVSLKSNGLGLSFLDPAKIKFFKENDVTTYHIGNKTVYLPRYLKKKIWTDDDEYRDMTERLMKKISERESALCKQSTPPGDLIVTIRQSDRLLDAISRVTPETLDLKINCDSLTVSVRDVISCLDRCGFVYDPDDDSMSILFCYRVDPLRFYRQKRYTQDSYRMKSVYNRRL